MGEDTRPQHETVPSYQEISPFEFSNKLISLAQEQTTSTRSTLNAGRGNPNWIADTPREAFFMLGEFALQESRRVWNEQNLAGMPHKTGIAARFIAHLEHNTATDGADLLQKLIHYGSSTFGFQADDWVYELADGIIGDNYPMPDRMLVHIEQVVHQFLLQELCGSDQHLGKFDLFAVEGATAAMCYIFDSLLANFLLRRGDKIAIMVPIFPPYVEIPQLTRYDFSVVEVKATAVNDAAEHTWQYPLSEIEKLSDPSVKALFVVNPGNPTSVALQPDTIEQIKQIVTEHNPNLMIISDDVYSTFVDNYRSLMAYLPYNTIGVYSLSKYFGVTGWRLGVVAIHEDNLFDQQLKKLPTEQKAILQERYASLSHNAEAIRFIDRMVADSRQVALNHTAGLSTPQQVQMALCCAFALLDRDNQYKQLTKQICQRRMQLLYEGLGLQQPNLPYSTNYYAQIDLDELAAYHYGKAFTNYLHANYQPVDFLSRLAEHSSIVLLHGGGFHAPDWSIRVSLANLDDAQYTQIGHELHATLEEYATRWKATKQ